MEDLCIKRLPAQWERKRRQKARNKGKVKTRGRPQQKENTDTLSKEVGRGPSIIQPRICDALCLLGRYGFLNPNLNVAPTFT